jgi:hypothetical protein
MNYLISLWRRRQRSIDLQVLWPACKDHAQDLDQARVAFAIHAYRDKAWLCLGEDEIRRQINELQ